MSNIHVCRELALDAEQCNELAETLLQELVNAFGGSYHADGEDYRYKHSLGVNALVEPRAGQLEVTVKLGIMTKALAPQLEQEMNKVLDEYLEDHEAE